MTASQQKPNKGSPARALGFVSAAGKAVQHSCLGTINDPAVGLTFTYPQSKHCQKIKSIHTSTGIVYRSGLKRVQLAVKTVTCRPRLDLLTTHLRLAKN
jgi:hypothetical protein